jgi:endonuclease YncB( thermonuclease family)
MAAASRIFSIVVGLGLAVLLLWPLNLPLVGFQEAWWAREQVVTRVNPPPALPSSVEPLFTKPAASASQAEAPRATHAVPNPDAPKPLMFARETADAERVAALEKKDETAAKPKPKTKLYYRVIVRDGGTIEAAGILITLRGILARDADAQCKDDSGKPWPCGARARGELTQLIHGRAVSCDLPASGERKSFTARCAVGGADLSAWMVSQGWAKPKEPAEPALDDAAADARKKHMGIWR